MAFNLLYLMRNGSRPICWSMRMPELEKISKEYADKGVEVVGLVKDVPLGDDTKLAEAKAILKDTGVTFTNLRAWKDFEEQLVMAGTPTTYFIDSEGKIIGDPIVGASVKKYRERLDELTQ